jgi:hypothetical protein
LSLKLQPAVPRLALRVGEAAVALGVSADYFAEHVAPELRWVRRGAVKLVPIYEVERWLRENAARTIEDEVPLG